ncbi:MAG: DUF4190 domain-containing protein [Verrucomicrobiota bacterium]
MSFSRPPVVLHALASFVAGIAALFVGGPVMGAAAIVFGVLGLNLIAKFDGSVRGKGLAWAGIVAGVAAILSQLIPLDSGQPGAQASWVFQWAF